jgi:NAD(P)-dependent dehydrogenase (short-subunit alcohol dehydrogenase family)
VKEIDINTICSGAAETLMLGRPYDAVPEGMEQVQRNQPIGRFGRSDEIVTAVLRLCSPVHSFVANGMLNKLRSAS